VKHILCLTATNALSALAFVSVLALAACDRGASETGGGFSSDREVFVAGSEVTSKNTSVAVYWKNGAKTRLSQGGSQAAANSVYAVGADVYVAGYEESAPGTSTALYWLNGQPNHLSKGNQHDTANSVFVSDGEVYVAGVESNMATIWVNGAQRALGRFPSEATSVCVSDGDVYVSGWEAASAEKRYAMLWTLRRRPTDAEATEAAEPAESSRGRSAKARAKADLWDGEAQRLSGGGKSDAALSVHVAGSTVYVAGYEEVNNITAATLWKNGAPTQVGQNGANSYAKCVHAVGGKVHVVLDENGYAKISTNGKKQLITDKSSHVHSVRAFMGDVYTAGTQGGRARLWLNNSLRRLNMSKTAKGSEARSIFVQ
jgi:hypothetical protein